MPQAGSRIMQNMQNMQNMKSKVEYPHSISRICLAQEFGLVQIWMHVPQIPNQDILYNRPLFELQQLISSEAV